jgi:hypothetical protein
LLADCFLYPQLQLFCLQLQAAFFQSVRARGVIGLACRFPVEIGCIG